MVVGVVNRFLLALKTSCRGIAALSLIVLTQTAHCQLGSILGGLLKVGGSATADAVVHKDPEVTFKIRVSDEEDRPVSDAQVMVRRLDTRYHNRQEWFEVGDDGMTTPSLRLFNESKSGRYEVLTRARGFALNSRFVELPSDEDVIQIQLSRGTRVSLQLRDGAGRDVPPDLAPSLFPESWAVPAWMSVQSDIVNDATLENPLSLYAVRRESSKGAAAEYSVHLDESSTMPLYVLVNHPGFMRAFQAGPFAAADWSSSKTLELTLPKPASLTGVLDLAGNEPESPVVTVELGHLRMVPGANRWSLRLLTEAKKPTSATIEANDLAPGQYSVEVAMAHPTERWSSNVYSTEESVTLDAGASETLTLTYAPFKKEWLEGPYTAKIKVLNLQGEPAAGSNYKLTWYESGYPMQTVAEGKVPADGVITIENLAGIEKTLTREEVRKLPRGVTSFSFFVDDQRLDEIGFFEYADGKFTPDTELTKELEFRLPPKTGDVAPDFAMHDIATSKTIRLSDLKGQVVLIDFWATWCGPCQGPMAENQEMLRKYKDEWKGKATILAVSIDDELDTVVKHLEKNDWHETHNTWAAPDPKEPDEVGWSAPAAKLYGINSIPTMVLVGSDGVIKERGHIRDLEASMLKYIVGE